MTRHCVIDSASIELENGAGDGAYDLLDVSGTPDEIGKAIADSLRDSDMSRGPEWFFLKDGDGELYLNVRIKFSEHPILQETEE
jgi:hypothetical protein